MFFSILLFLISSFSFNLFSASQQLPDDFISATISFIQVEKPDCHSLNKYQPYLCDQCSEFHYIQQTFHEALYSLIFTLGYTESHHIMKIIHDLQSSVYLKKNSLSDKEIAAILQLSPQEYEAQFYPKKEIIKKSPAQKRRAKALSNSKEADEPLRRTRTYFYLLSAIKEAIDLLNKPNARFILEKNFITKQNAFNFNEFIQFFAHERKSNSATKIKILDSELSSDLNYFTTNKYGNHHFYEVQARTVRLFKKTLKKYLHDHPTSSLHDWAESNSVFFSEKKKQIDSTLKAINFFLSFGLTKDLKTLTIENYIEKTNHNFCIQVLEDVE